MSTPMDDTTSLTLSRLLSRLEHSLLSPASESRLRNSAYERKRVGSNLDHARALLSSLEQQSNTVRIHSQKQQAQTELPRHRDTIRRLDARIQELGEQSKDDSDSEVDEDDTVNASEPVVKHSYAPARADINAGIDIGDKSESNEVLKKAAESVTNELRSRRPEQQTAAPTATTTAREDLFAGHKQHLDFETSEALMAHNTKEQEVLTQGLLGLAKALKESSLNFASSLESEKDVLKRAEGGLDKSAQGMEAAERKMGMLRRMSEGQGWWGRIKLYGFIAGLWLACFLLVFLGPKLRF